MTCHRRGVCWFFSIALIAAATLIAHLATAAEKAADFDAIFNGNDFDGWTTIIDNVPVATSSTFTVRDGLIVITGAPKGYIATKKTYRDFAIKFDWKFARPADLVDDEKFSGNGGLLIYPHGSPVKGSFPPCVEVQGANRKHGMVFDAGGAQGGSYEFDQAALQSVRKPVGEWNTTEVDAAGGRSSSE